MLIVGTAGWAIPREQAAHFRSDGTALERYVSRFAGVEINSSFYRPHRRSTWERWAASVHTSFRFAVKMPKVISHERRLRDCDEPLGRFLDEVEGLGDKLGVLLLQLPPKLAFEQPVAEAFFSLLAGMTDTRVVCEPRHPSWFDPIADALLRDFEVARVAADPALVPTASVPGGWRGLAYHRLHGSPQIYRSSYDDGRLDELAGRLSSEASAEAPLWCIFDNTASGVAIRDALQLVRNLNCGAHSGISTVVRAAEHGSVKIAALYRGIRPVVADEKRPSTARWR